MWGKLALQELGRLSDIEYFSELFGVQFSYHKGGNLIVPRYSCMVDAKSRI